LKHYLITRFNLRVPQWRDTDKKGNKILTPEWLEHRWKLFQKFTVPSVMAQTNQQFTWLVLFDIGTEVKDGPYLPVFCSTEWLKELQSYLRQHCTDTWVITSRLDNDDAIAPEFMSTIQDAAIKKTQFLNIPNGTSQRGLAKKSIHHRANHFISFVEPGDHPKSVYFTPHSLRMDKYAPIIQVPSKKRLWTQIIHERNYIND